MKAQIISDVSSRDGIGMEFYKNDELCVEIFRDDTAKTKMVAVFVKSIDLGELEKCIEQFKAEIPSEFIE